MAKKEKISNPVNFQGNDFKGFSYINTAGDTIRLFTTTEARPGEYYQIEYVMPKDNSPMKIRTEKDTAGLLAGKKYAVDPNGNVGDWLNESFLIPAKQLPINHDRSKATGIKKLGYKVLEYLDKFDDGGAVKNNKPYYSWNVKGERGALGLPGNVSIYNQYPTGNYNTAFIQNRDGGHELIEVGKAAGIKSEIYNKYDKDGILQHSDSTFNGYSNKTPEGKAFQKHFENNIYDMTYKKYQQGGQMDNQLGQLAKAAFQMANELKKQGAISEVAGEQVIAQAFQQTPEAAKMFVEAAQKQDVQTIVQLFTKLGIVK